MKVMDLEALARLVDAHAPALVLYARQWCAAPEDVVQEAFLKLAAQRRVPDQPAAWLYRVVRNSALSAARSEKRRRHHEAVAAGQSAGGLAKWRGGRGGRVVAHGWGGLTFEQIVAVTGVAASPAHRRYLAALSA